MDLSKGAILNKLQKVQDKKLFAHSKATGRMAVSLAENLIKKNPSLKINIEKIETASLLHDWAKGFSADRLISLAKKYNLNIDDYESKNPGLLHGPVGAVVLESELGIKDKVILKAIRNHTTGDNKMSLFDKIIFVADHIEVNRNYRMVDKIRDIALTDFNKAVMIVIENKIFYVLKQRILLHPRTVSAWNSVINEKN